MNNLNTFFFNLKLRKIEEFFPNLKSRLSLQEQILFTKRLSILVRSGVLIPQALKMMAKQANKLNTKMIFEKLIDQVQHGKALHIAMRQQQKVFGELSINVVEIGEISGNLSDCLSHLADELQKKQNLKRKVMAALIYPAFIIVATLGITFLLVVYLFPKILPVFKSVNTELPLSTRTLIFLSDGLISHGWLVILILIILAGAVVFVNKLKKARSKIDSMLLGLPVLGGLFQHYHTANFCRTLSLLLKSGCPIVKAVSIAGRSSGNMRYQNEFERLVQHISAGSKLRTFFEKNTHLFPAITGQMILVGEESGHLPQTLLYLAELHEAEVDDLTKNLTTIMEPMLMVCMGILVGFVAIAIITPIYEITQSLQP